MPEAAFILLAAGLGAGFIAGLVGVGGGIIFAPVLLFYFHATGVAEPYLTPLTIGTSLFCTLLTSSISAFHHYRRGAVVRRIALLTGLSSAAGVFAVSMLVATQPWYDQRAFQLLFSIVLVTVAVRMMLVRESENQGSDESAGGNADHTGFIAIGSIGTIAGALSSAVGVGGGVVLVPAFNRIMRLPMHTSVGTSSAAIIIISAAGVLSYALLGLSSVTVESAIGFVDPATGLALSIPALFTARLGVVAAHRFNPRNLRIGFAVFAIIVGVRLTMRALGA